MTDPSGLCAQPTQWWNPVDANCYYSAVGLAQRFSQGDPQAYNAWFDILIQKDWGELKVVEGTGSLNDLLSNASILPNLFYQNPQAALQALQQYLSGCNNGTMYGMSIYYPNFDYNGGQGGQGGALLVLSVAAIGLILIGYAAAGAIARSQPSGTSLTYEFRLTGFDKKVDDLAEHLAKLLPHEVAGYPTFGPDRNHDPDRGWCLTIRRIIQQIDNAGYSQRQFNRDLEAAGIGSDTWNEIVDAVREVSESGLCDDHWGDFTGGSLAFS